MGAPVKLLIHGASGRMGQALIRLAQANPLLKVVAMTGRSAFPPLAEVPEFDVAVDFSSPEGFDAVLALCLQRGKPLVSGTTGLGPGQFQALKQAGERYQARIERVRSWLAGMTLSAVSVFLLTWAGLAALKVPLALLSGLVCGLLTFVPTIGPTVATLLPLAVALLVSPTLALQVLILRLVLQNGEAFLLTPLLLSRTVNLLPTVALMAQLSLGALLGLPGVLLALPLVVVLQVLSQRVLVEQIMDRWL